MIISIIGNSGKGTTTPSKRVAEALGKEKACLDQRT